LEFSLQAALDEHPGQSLNSSRARSKIIKKAPEGEVASPLMIVLVLVVVLVLDVTCR
jgi:hypothetical protein